MPHCTSKNRLLLGLITAGVSPFAIAQPMLEEVVVTAQRKAESLVDAPLTVNVVSGDEIRSLSMFQADELSKLTAGVEFRYEGDSNGGVAIRGVGTLAQQAAPSRVGIYLDDWYGGANSNFVFKQMFDISQVQVLRGPQGTLYGQPSPTGAVIFNTADPDLSEVTGYIQGSYMDPTGYNVQGAISIPLIRDKLAIRLSGLKDERETGLVNITRDLDNQVNSEGYRAKLLWMPTDNFETKLGWTHVQSEDLDTYRPLESISPDANFQLEASDRNSIQDAPDQVNKAEDDLFTLHMNWDTGPVELRFFAANHSYNVHSDSDNDFTEQPVNTVQVNTDTEKNEQYELRALATPVNWWATQFGYYYATREIQTDVPVFTNSPANNLVAATTLDIPSGSDTEAIFTHNDFYLSDATTLIVGLRYNIFTSNASNTSQTDLLIGSEMLPGGEITDPTRIVTRPCPDGTAAPCLLAGDEEDRVWTGTIKLSHAFSDDLNTYATYDRGFRPGAPNFDIQGLIPEDYFSYEGETVNSFELGVKGQLWGGQAQYSAATFYNLYDNYQVVPAFPIYDPLRGPVEITSVYANADEVVQLGIEGEFRMAITENWSMFTSLAWNQVEFKEGEIPCSDPGQPPLGPDNSFNTCDVSGEPAGEQPQWTWSLQSEYRAPLALTRGDWFVQGLFSYRGETEIPGDINGRLTADAFGLLDLYAGLGGERWEAKLWVKNALDDDEVIVKRSAGPNYNDLSLAAPRTTGITLSYFF